MRTKTHKLVTYPDSANRSELYDLVADPHESTNLIDSFEHAEILAALRARLEELRRGLGDLPEPRPAAPPKPAPSPRSPAPEQGSTCREVCVPCSGNQPCIEKCSQVGDCPPRPCGVVERCVEGHVFSEATCRCVSSGG